MLALFGLQPGRVAMPLARTAAQKALDRDPSQPEAHAILGAVAATYDFDWKEADQRFRMALDCEPVSPWVRGLHANFYLLFFGRLREAVEQWNRAVEADPLNLFFRFNRASCLQQSGQLDAAVEELHKVLEIDENYWIAYLLLGANYAARGLPAESLAAAQKAYQAAPWSQRAAGLFAGALHMSGDTGRASDVLEKLKAMPGPQMPLAMTTYHLMRSDPEGAANWFEKAIEQRDPGVIHNIRSPIGKDLRRSEHWRRIMRTMNLPETAA
jgi:tetratricopeptide (TPR) repeat protein